LKVYENTFRSVNIALANEMALLCDKMNINVWEVLDAAFTKPFGIMPFYPGPGVGGHCIPIDQHYLEWKAKEYGFQTRFIGLAGEINRRMPRFVLDKVSRMLNKVKKPLNGSSVLMLGMAYKRNVPDYRESPALEVYKLLLESGCDVSYHDQFVPEVHCNNFHAASVDLSEQVLRQADLVLITTPHENLDYEYVVRVAKQVLDTRNITKGIAAENLVLL
jgi:UDP-N-acetyl-D-glucosamine dehydrogenase